MMLMKIRLISYDYVDDVRRLVLLGFKAFTSSVEEDRVDHYKRYKDNLITKLIITVDLRELLRTVCLRLSKGVRWGVKELVEGVVEEVIKVLPEVHKLS